jgi:hypothetical protein
MEIGIYLLDRTLKLIERIADVIYLITKAHMDEEKKTK